jgi:3-oxoacyl-[acyl-carrier-protein] synthase-3
MSAAADGQVAVWTDFGGVLTAPVSETLADFSRRVGVDATVLHAAMVAVGAAHGTDMMAPLDTPLMTENEWTSEVERMLRTNWGVDADLSDFADNWFANRQANAGWVACLQEFRAQGCFVGLLSNMVPSWEQHWRAMVPPEGLFDDLVLSYLVGCRKPEAGIFKLAARRAGIPPSSCVLVDDLPANCRGAEAAGWHAVDFTTAAEARPLVEEMVSNAKRLLHDRGARGRTCGPGRAHAERPQELSRHEAPSSARDAAPSGPHASNGSAAHAIRCVPPRTASILGLGAYLPSDVLTSQAIAQRLGVEEEWIVKRTGIHARRRAKPSERTSDLATIAARRALEDAGLEPANIDLVLVATMSQDEATPNTAPLVAHALGAEHAGAFDVGAACTGWLAALAQAASQVESGRAERVLVIGVDTLTRMTDYDDAMVAGLFGDGAAAVVVGPDGEGTIGPIRLAADGSLGPVITANLTDRMIRMDGTSTFKIAVSRLSESIVRAVAGSGWQLDDVDLFVPHQANARIIRAVGARLELDPAKVADYVGDLGNTSAASIPIALSLLRTDGRLRPGDKVVLAAIGAGFTWGAGTLTWSGVPESETSPAVARDSAAAR